MENIKVKSDVYPGDIVKVRTRIYVYYQGGDWKDHFTDGFKTYVVRDIPTNNGNFTARDDKGRMIWLNTVTDDIQVVKRREK